ncbi:unnamed protein product [Peronospora belbahrii]|uniref:Uncharacterized protein n=1 Tax=Peronospora belbahrii TaxID=622444 RepID=A0ABN8CVX9_9STRA|nr:unnamed protein product [Peronospora belbahrii]
MLLRSSTEASVSTQQLTCQCTCVIETESDSDNDSDNECNKIGNEVAGENGLRGGSSRPPPSKWSKSLSLQTASELIQNSQALHNAENLRQATVLDNVFCSLYDVDTVLHTVQRREERGQFTPLQKLLLAPESVEQVFGYATSGRTMYPNGQENRQQYDEKDPNRPNAATYRQAFVATEIILHFYLKVVAWYGEPKADLMEDSGKVVDTAMQKGTKQEAIPKQSRTECTEQTVPLTQASPSKATSLMDFQSNTSTRKMARIQRLRANMRFESSGSSISDFSGDDNGLIEDPSTRGYLLRFDDLTANEWKRIFGKLFLCFCPQLKFDGDEKGKTVMTA